MNSTTGPVAAVSLTPVPVEPGSADTCELSMPAAPPRAPPLDGSFGFVDPSADALSDPPSVLRSDPPHPIISPTASTTANPLPRLDLFMLEARDLEKTYRSGERTLTVLRDVNLRVGDGDFIAILGPSGSGKTTL